MSTYGRVDAAIAQSAGMDSWAALGDPSRRRIFAHLAEQPRSVTELANELPISRPAVSQHLKVLLDVNLVSVEPRGTRRIYRVNPAGLEPIRADLDHFWSAVLTNVKNIAEQHES